jgi:excisionase family DNA binding protein
MLGRDERDVLLTRQEAAAYCRVSMPTMENWAKAGTGPPVRRLGRNVRYSLADLRDYVMGVQKPHVNRPRLSKASDI